MCRFSVVIPVYKVEEYLDQCVQSVLNQTYSDMEVILVDDGSPDNCGAMCDRWAETDSRVRVIHQKNGGLSAARNTGIQNAAGEYVLFLDSDDWWENDEVLSAIACQLERTPVDVLSFNYRKSYDGKPQPTYFDENLPSSQKVEGLAEIVSGDRWINGACNKAISRILLVSNGLYFREGITSEDIDWTLRLALAAETFAFANICVFVYRQHASSISNSPSLKKIQMLCGNVQTCIQLLKDGDANKAKLLEAYTAYQYGTLVYGVANLPKAERKCLMADVKVMKYLLACSNNSKVRLLYKCDRLFGLSITMWLLRLRHEKLQRSGKGV